MPFELVLLYALYALAVKAIVHIWLYSSLFEPLQTAMSAVLDARYADAKESAIAATPSEDTAPATAYIQNTVTWPNYIAGRLHTWMLELLTCQLCLSVHVAFWYGLLIIVPTLTCWFNGSWLLWLFLTPTTVFSIVTLVNSPRIWIT